MKHLIQFKRVKAILGVILLAGLSSVTRVAAQTGDGDKYHDKGVTIDGVTWATRNVDMPGTFAATPRSPGMLYQWGSRIGWSSNDPLINSNGETVWYWDYQTHGTEWEPANDPCPSGWRVPTTEELGLLLIAYERTTDGPKGEFYTKNDKGAGIFLPRAGQRRAFDNATRRPGRYTLPQHLTDLDRGYYYTSKIYENSGGGDALMFHNAEDVLAYKFGTAPGVFYPVATYMWMYRDEACSIRCVRK
jgi:hypothetical protein